MKHEIDIDKILAQGSGVQPRRPLRAGFIKDITDHLGKHPQPHSRRRFARLKELLTMKRMSTRPVLAGACAIVLLATGTAGAAVSWPHLRALFGGQENLANGDRIVRVNTENCIMTTALTVTSDKGQHVYFYRVRYDSRLTNDQIVQLVRGNCIAEQQSRFDEQYILTQLNKNPANKNTVVGGYLDSTITAITPHSVDLESVIPFNTTLKTVKQTFSHIDPHVVVYDSPHEIPWSSLRVGDHVSVKYRASGEALTHSETLPPDQINADEQTIVTVIKISPDLHAATDFQKYNGTEFEQVTPCTHGGSNGYCNAQEYQER